MTLYIYSKCSTCQNALRFLQQHHISLKCKEITLTPPTLAELELMLSYKNGNLKRLFNTSGLLYKELGLSSKLDQMSQKEALTLLSQHGMLVKRPFLIEPAFGLTGFNEKEWVNILPLLNNNTK